VIAAISGLGLGACATTHGTVAPATSTPRLIEAPPADAAAAETASVSVAATDPVEPLEAPRAILLLGDSKIATDFGAALHAELSRTRPELTVSRRGKSATGLARPDFFDWMREAELLIERHRPDVIVVAMGGNDGQDLVSLDTRTRAIAWKSDAWAPTYAARLRAFLDLLAGERRTSLAPQARVRVVWTEITAADRPRLEAKLRVIREIQRDAVAAFGPRAIYLETRAHFYDPSGALVRHVDVSGRAHALRQDDGIHFTVRGSRWLASRVAADLRERVGLTSE